MDPCAHGRFHDFGVRRVGPAVADIFPHGAREEEDILLDDPDILAEALLRERADILPVYGNAAVCHIIKARDQVAHGRLTAAGFAHQRDGLARSNVQIHVVEHPGPVVIREGDILEADIASYIGQYPGIRRVLDLRLRAHELHEPVKSGHSLRVDLHELRQLPNRRREGRDVKGKGDQVDIAELPPHDQNTSHCNDSDLHQADRGFDARVEDAHGFVEGDPALLEGLVRDSELLVFGPFVGKCFRSPDAGDAALDGGVDLAGPLFDLAVGALHVEALPHSEDDAGGDHDEEYQRQDRIDRKQDDQRADDGERARQDVLRAVVRQFHDLEQVVGNARHKDTGPVPVKKAVGQRLHMCEDIPAHVRFDHCSHAVSDHSDKILTHRADQIRREHDQHDAEKGLEESFRKKAPHGPP